MRRRCGTGDHGGVSIRLLVGETVSNSKVVSCDIRLIFGDGELLGLQNCDAARLSLGESLRLPSGVLDALPPERLHLSSSVGASSAIASFEKRVRRLGRPPLPEEDAAVGSTTAAPLHSSISASMRPHSIVATIPGL